MLRQFRAQGATRLSFLGGEPTVNPRLSESAVAAKAMGFRFVRVNTNGMFRPSWLQDQRTRSIDAICFSIDGSTPAVNDAIRKGSRLTRVVDAMQQAARLGYDVRANMTVTSANVDQVADVIALVQQSGGAEINLNVMFEMGYAAGRDDLAVPRDRWRLVYEHLQRHHADFTIRIKVPPAFALPSEIGGHRAAGHRCVAADGSRVYVASNGDVFTCLTMMDDRERRTAEYVMGRIRPVRTADWPARVHDYCHFVKLPTAGALPLCIFHKSRLNA
jgi:MoaA/NifB/PqqE/SkfB family radical SAM enzyme